MRHTTGEILAVMFGWIAVIMIGGVYLASIAPNDFSFALRLGATAVIAILPLWYIESYMRRPKNHRSY
jgi:membrane protein implicated in regulation of membrane protease activity